MGSSQRLVAGQSVERMLAVVSALLLGVAVLVAPTSGRAAAEAYVCVNARFFNIADLDEAGEGAEIPDPISVIMPGMEVVIEVSIGLEVWAEGTRPDFDDDCRPLVVTDGFSSEQVGNVFGALVMRPNDVFVRLTLVDPTNSGAALAWSVLDASLITGASAPGLGEDPFFWSVVSDGTTLGDVANDEVSLADFFAPDPWRSYPDNASDFVAATGYLGGALINVRSDARPGPYVLFVQGLALSSNPGVPPRTFLSLPVLVPFEVFGNLSSTPPAPAASVSCGAPTVGSSVSCTLTSEPSFDFVWQASTNPMFASGVVTTDATGTGEFSFTVPVGALGLPVLVEIVDWTGAEAIGVASPPVPSTVPAGERGEVPVGMLVMLLLGVVALLGGMARFMSAAGR